MAIVVGHDIKFPVEVVRNFTNRELTCTEEDEIRQETLVPISTMMYSIMRTGPRGVYTV